MVRRVLVGKREDFDVESRRLTEDIRQNLKISKLEKISVINRYDVEGLDEGTFEDAVKYVFSEPNLDIVYGDKIEMQPGETAFSVEYMTGQYDQRADSARQCIKLINSQVDGVVKCAKTYILSGGLSEDQIEKIKKYVINPVDSQEAAEEIPASLGIDSKEPEDIRVVNLFITMEEEELKALCLDMGLAMADGDLKFIQRYFIEEGRNPTVTELKVIDTYWSDHCRHTTFNTELTDIYFEDSPYGNMVKNEFSEYMKMRRTVYGDYKKDVSLMDMACIGAKYLKKEGLLDDLDESEEINACSIHVDAHVDGRVEDWLVMFKNETHNHPTEIEPFGGAATCLGGAIRDPLSGRAYVYQAMRVTGSADPRQSVENTLAGKLPQRKITSEAASGYSSYGNQIGLATGQVNEVYHAGYMAKRMEVGAVIGAAPAENVVRKIPAEGDVIVLVGGRTGRDGCGGATGSSREHSKESITLCGAEVQKGNPPVERNIQRFFKRNEVATMIKRCNDFGAGGVSVAIGELADGLHIDLDKVPKKYEGLDGTELAISESQERMAVVLAKDDLESFISYGEEENLEVTEVATVTGDNRMQMYWRGEIIVDISREFLNTGGAKQEQVVKVRKQGDLAELRYPGRVEDLLDELNCCSQKGLVSMFDATIGSNTVLMPLGGKYQLSPAMGMAAKLPVSHGECKTATLMTYGFSPVLAEISPFHGAMYAVIESVAKIVAMGGDRRRIRLSFQEYFEKLTTEEAWGKPMGALLGALRIQRELKIPAIGGKDSMSGTFEDIKVPPTLISFAVTSVDSDVIISTEFKEENSYIVLVKGKRDGLGSIDLEKFKVSMDRVTDLIVRGEILAACALGEGGVFMGAVKMAAGNGIGFSLSVNEEDELKGYMQGSILLEIPVKEGHLDQMFAGVDYVVAGRTNGDQSVNYIEKGTNVTIPLEEVVGRWRKPLEDIFPTGSTGQVFSEDMVAEANVDSGKDLDSIGGTSKSSCFGRPRVLIPAFPGTNCEEDSKRAFDRAGGLTKIHLIRNMTEHALEESILELERGIKDSQIIMLPGGFSGGDEPDGSAKFITAIFRNDRIQEAVTEFLQERDGLMLGICNGFQALIKLGLLPFGKILDQKEDSPTLSYNDIGRHQSAMVRTRINSNGSIWLSSLREGEIFTIPVSHGEGKFICGDATIQEMERNGQIATQYVDFAGQPSMDVDFNPNGSKCSIEGITSPDGRIFGKMGHSERIGKNLYKNIRGKHDMKIFESGLSYFK